MRRRVYLCSRTAPDAHALNDVVSEHLQRLGYHVFVPHQAPHNVGAGAPDSEVFLQDMREMQKADLCVVVGRIGIDCAFEVGWFHRKGVPTVWIFPPTEERHPMLHEVRKTRELEELTFLLSQGESK